MKRFLVAIAMAGCGFLLEAHAGEPPLVFTAAQAMAGRTAYESTCIKCHTPTLLGRKGAPGELPALASLPANMQETVRAAGGKVPPLAGPRFMARWAPRTTQVFSARMKSGVSGFPPEGTDSQTYLNLTAYILQVNGARPGTQALTSTTSVPIRSLQASASER